jgi:fucose permease
MSPIMLLVAPRTPGCRPWYGANRVVGLGMMSAAVGYAMFARVTPGSGYLYVLVSLFFFIAGLALTMSPMTSSIMSAVPARRAGAGSAMNDATWELGSALGVPTINRMVEFIATAAARTQTSGRLLSWKAADWMEPDVTFHPLVPATRPQAPVGPCSAASPRPGTRLGSRV